MGPVEHSRLGHVTPEDGEGVVLESGEMLDLRCAIPEGITKTLDLFVLFKASAATVSPSRAQKTGDGALPIEFAMGQNEPNPFGASTLFRFAVPSRSMVMLDVFDVGGRRVKTLTRGVWPAGYHTLNWNGRDTQGRRAGPGVYFYRMVAGSFRANRKLVVLP